MPRQAAAHQPNPLSRHDSQCLLVLCSCSVDASTWAPDMLACILYLNVVYDSQPEKKQGMRSSDTAALCTGSAWRGYRSRWAYPRRTRCRSMKLPSTCSCRPGCYFAPLTDVPCTCPGPAVSEKLGNALASLPTTITPTLQLEVPIVLALITCFIFAGSMPVLSPAPHCDCQHYGSRKYLTVSLTDIDSVQKSR